MAKRFINRISNSWIASAIAFCINLGFAAVVNAQSSGLSSPPSPNITSVGQVLQAFCTAFGWMFWFLIALSLIMIIYAAFIYVTAGDSAEKVSKATKTLTYAAIGVAVALLARAFPLIVANFLGVQNLQTC